MHSTRNDLPLSVRGKVSQLLESRLADGIDLMLQAKHAHWNVRGQNFLSLHELFDEAAEKAEEFVDAITDAPPRSAPSRKEQSALQQSAPHARRVSAGHLARARARRRPARRGTRRAAWSP